MAKRRYDPEAAKQDILDAAERLFAERGYGDVSTARLAREAGVSQSQIHYHFETKLNLWRAVFRRMFAEYHAVQASALDSTDYEGIDRMEASIRAYFGFVRDNPNFIGLMARYQLMATDGETEPMSAGLMSHGTEVIRAGQQAGILRSDLQPEFMLIGFLSLVAYWFQCRNLYLPLTGAEGDPADYDESYLDFILKVYLKGISPE